VYWMGPAIAHLFVSFGFGDDHLAISIEARQDRTREYATLPGFFRQYELVYVVADERDVIRVRTNYRKSPPEDVYLFRVIGPIENGRRIFLDYMRDINRLREHPRFYNTLTTNCTTMILAHAAVNPGHLPLSWKVLLSGYAAEYAYDEGRLDRTVSFEELKRCSHINAAAQAADKAPDFSRRIRVGLPRSSAVPPSGKPRNFPATNPVISRGHNPPRPGYALFEAGCHHGSRRVRSQRGNAGVRGAFGPRSAGRPRPRSPGGRARVARGCVQNGRHGRRRSVVARGSRSAPARRDGERFIG
jgi:hypothetical protein